MLPEFLAATAVLIRKYILSRKKAEQTFYQTSLRDNLKTTGYK